ncbi:hypothetical protein DCAR_0727055 [Daucus carota subsp. sativus]|uniref:Uncharacterized protein n=1 Tax=Daucus carota subsp. sativus TaxID=79200 RepID=A0A164SPY3_DAUCS|nr:PREDICTED: F-box protein SKIP28 [Daucus carota subsp. sativus]WOH07622.1 hypothetical protein DCAR_0727055 [Daucus carota subsp. sativus]
MDMEVLDTEQENTSHEVTNNLTQSRPGPPHDSVFLVLSRLPLVELLSMSLVCKSLKDAVDDDILLWLNIFVDKPLNSRISDHTLMDITSKANGRLKSLALIECLQITDAGLEAVVAKNPLINKLYVPECTSLTAEGIIRVVEMLAQHSRKPILLKLNGIHDINSEHLEIIRALIQLNQRQQMKFYHKRNQYLLDFNEQSETNPDIDLDTCPKCSEVRMVFDCPDQMCRQKSEGNVLSACRGCQYCVPRCEECGRCVTDSEERDEAEAACNDILCMDCWFRLPKCNFCNKPYCKLHAQKKQSLPESSGFLCEVCYSDFI